MTATGSVADGSVRVRSLVAATPLAEVGVRG